MSAQYKPFLIQIAHTAISEAANKIISDEKRGVQAVITNNYVFNAVQNEANKIAEIGRLMLDERKELYNIISFFFMKYIISCGKMVMLKDRFGYTRKVRAEKCYN